VKQSVKLYATLAAGVLVAAACATGSSGSSSASGNMSPADINMSPTPPSPDPRVGLKPGTMVPWAKDPSKKVLAERAGEASWNLRLIANMPPAEPFVGVTHSDLAFKGPYVIQGNYDGYQVWDITNPHSPLLYDEYVCRGSQSDVSVYKNLIFVSGEAPTGRLDCGTQGVPDSVSKERLRGIRVFDATDMKHPKYVANVQTCRGSHTHTVVEDPKDNQNIYVYISGSSGVRPEAELAGCKDLSPDVDPAGEQFRIEVIQVPLAHPELAHVVSKPGILMALGVAPRNNARTVQDSIERASAPPRAGAAGRAGGPPRPPQVARGPVQCHDITVYPAVGLAGGACGGYGLLLDISDVKNPKRLYAAADSNMQFWHSATFNNDGTKVLFSDEWGGGSAPRCRSTDHYEWGSDAIFTITDKKEVFQSYYKMPAAQTQFENCVAHNGSLVPIPGRDIMIQAWYQGGISMFEWTDAKHPKEIAFFDRGPVDVLTAGASAGSWSAYWYNGVIVSSEIARGLDVFEVLPSAFITQNELDAAKSVHQDYLNVQGQQKLVWPATFSLSRAYLDQLARDGGQTSDKIAAARASLASAERLSGQARKDALDALAKQLHGDAQGAKDAPKAHKLAYSVGDLAKL
jgi:hypothetical protein